MYDWVYWNWALQLCTYFVGLIKRFSASTKVPKRVQNFYSISTFPKNRVGRATRNKQLSTLALKYDYEVMAKVWVHLRYGEPRSLSSIGCFNWALLNTWGMQHGAVCFFNKIFLTGLQILVSPTAPITAKGQITCNKMTNIFWIFRLF